MITIAECYQTLGEHFLEADMFKAYGYLEEAAKNGSGKAAIKVAEHYEKLGKYQNAYQALLWAIEADDEVFAEASYKLGTYYEYGYAGLEKNCEQAYEYYACSAEAGFKPAKRKMPYEGVKKLGNDLKKLLL